MTDTPPDYASSAAVAGLARELEALRRTATEAVGARQQVADLAAVVADLAIAVEQLTASPTVNPPVCWLDFADDETKAFAVLAKLTAWAEAIYLRYGDAALPDCWLWHPDVVEELLWLSGEWQASYAGKRASTLRVADWHDRLRPGVARRIRAAHGSCSIESHTEPRPAPGPTDPQAIEVIAAWWSSHRSEPAPAPTPDLLAAAAARPTRGRR